MLRDCGLNYNEGSFAWQQTAYLYEAKDRAMEPTGASSTTVQTGFLKHSLQYQTRSLVLTKSSQHPDAVICESGSESWQPQLISLVLYNHTNNRGR